MSCEVHGTGPADLAVAARSRITTYYSAACCRPHVDYDAPPAHMKRIDDQMDADGYVHLRNDPGLGQDIDFAYIEGNS